MNNGGYTPPAPSNITHLNVTPLIGNNNLYTDIYNVNPTAASDISLGVQSIVNGLMLLGVNQYDAEITIYNAIVSLSNDTVNNNSITNLNGYTLYGPQSSNFNSETWQNLNWQPNKYMRFTTS